MCMFWGGGYDTGNTPATLRHEEQKMSCAGARSFLLPSLRSTQLLVKMGALHGSDTVKFDLSLSPQRAYHDL